MDIKTTAHNIGETLAKLYFELDGYFVYTNSSGKSEFDMVLSKNGILKSVEVKTVSVEKFSTKGSYYEVQLKSVRSNTTNNTIHKFDNTTIDFLVVVCLNTKKLKVFNAKDVKFTSSFRIYGEEFIDILQ